MKDSSLPKFVLAILAFIAVGFAIWTGFATRVEAPEAGAAAHGAFTTPF